MEDQRMEVIQRQNLSVVDFMQVVILSFKCKQIWAEVCVYSWSVKKFILIKFCFYFVLLEPLMCSVGSKWGYLSCIIGCKQHHLWTKFRIPLTFGGETFRWIFQHLPFDPVPWGLINNGSVGFRPSINKWSWSLYF